MAVPLRKSRLRFGDVIGLGTAGIRARPLRAILSALGIAIGIAAMIAVVTISASSQERLNSQLAALGTNLLTVSPGKTAAGEPVALPPDSVGRVERIEGVVGASSVARLAQASVYPNNRVDPGLTAGLSVEATDLGLLAVMETEVAIGTWLNPATATLPTTVLGSIAAERLGVTGVGHQVWLGGRNFTVVGILSPLPLAPDLDSAAFVGIPVAIALLGFDGSPTTVYERSTDQAVSTVRMLIGPTLQPETPGAVAISRPSDALAARSAVDEAFTGLLLALGSIALLVGGIGVANTMVISVLERRREIGLRRALGATRHHISQQFLAEALVLSALGGLAGAIIGSAVSAIIAAANGWIPVIPIPVLIAGVGATLLIGAIAGLYPAIRASRTPPTVALSG